MLTPIVPEVLRAKVGVFVDLYLKTEQVKQQAEQLRRMVQQHASTLKISAVRSDRGFRRVHQHPLKQKPECDGATGTVNATARPSI